MCCGRPRGSVSYYQCTTTQAPETAECVAPRSVGTTQLPRRAFSAIPCARVEVLGQQGHSLWVIRQRRPCRCGCLWEPA